MLNNLTIVTKDFYREAACDCGCSAEEWGVSLKVNGQELGEFSSESAALIYVLENLLGHTVAQLVDD